MPDRDQKPGASPPTAKPLARSESLETELAALDAMLPDAPADETPAQPIQPDATPSKAK
jgi:hypothetical protein